MNVEMWNNPATQANIKTLRQRGFMQVGPNSGAMACGETGAGRMAEPEDIFDAITAFFSENQPLKGKTALVTAGPTYEPLDPVRFLGNRSSGKQGYAIAAALTKAGVDVTLVTGPVALPAPAGIKTVHIETAAEMATAVDNALPADIAICAAAVSDWAPANAQSHKIKKQQNDTTPPTIKLRENPDILARIVQNTSQRPALVVGFAAETDKLLENAAAKRTKKGCEWIVANDVAGDEKVFGADQNHVFLLTESGTTEWPRASKADIAQKLGEQIAIYFEGLEYERAPIAAE
jgi:phosphopantothenoylcysteine decarboxylase/phosphopantothenate--cysteine ligase